MPSLRDPYIPARRIPISSIASLNILYSSSAVSIPKHFFYTLCCGQDTCSLLQRYRWNRMLSEDMEVSFFFSAGVRDRVIAVAETNVRALHCNWLYKWRSLEKFLRVVQKIPINLSGAKVEELRDAATVRRKYQEPKDTRNKLQNGKSTRRQDDGIANVDTPIKLRLIGIFWVRRGNLSRLSCVQRLQKFNLVP